MCLLLRPCFWPTLSTAEISSSRARALESLHVRVSFPGGGLGIPLLCLLGSPSSHRRTLSFCGVQQLS
eukprot:895811-Alexandrium_andersonii.AAC.1